MAELVVVMVLLGLVVLIATSVTLMVNRAQQNYKIDSKSQAEILRLEEAFKDCLMLCDSEEFILIIGDRSIEVSKEEISATPPVIEFKDGTLSYFTGAENNVKTIEFESIKDITFSNDDDIVCCTVTFIKTDYEHKILYTMRAITQIRTKMTSAGDSNE